VTVGVPRVAAGEGVPAGVVGVVGAGVVGAEVGGVGRGAASIP